MRPHDDCGPATLQPLVFKWIEEDQAAGCIFACIRHRIDRPRVDV